MAQLLLGFPLDSDSHVLPPDPHRFYTCLSVVLQVDLSPHHPTCPFIVGFRLHFISV
jgi:hypothetical protein